MLAPMKRAAGIFASALLLCSSAFTQQSWTVKPEWVHAHEEFLASDILQGRGSATRDEGIAAAYVGSQFHGYGLALAPGMKSYVEQVEVEKPELDGRALISFAGISLQEGGDFYLPLSSGVSRWTC